MIRRRYAPEEGSALLEIDAPIAREPRPAERPRVSLSTGVTDWPHPIPHLDGLTPPAPNGPPLTFIGTFTILAGVFFTDQRGT